MTPDNLRDVLAEGPLVHRTALWLYAAYDENPDRDWSDETEQARESWVTDARALLRTLLPTVARLIADARTEQAAADRARVEAEYHPADRPGSEDFERGYRMAYRHFRAALDSEGGA
jgi:hypothetical protein